jgi:hypothetical protein
MREFTDPEGRPWRAFVREEPGTDYKGRFFFVMQRTDASDGEDLALEDIRWNNERTARRTLQSMSVVELRRRLRSALGRRTAVGV